MSAFHPFSDIPELPAVALWHSAGGPHATTTHRIQARPPACQLLLGHTKLESTVKYFGVGGGRRASVASHLTRSASLADGQRRRHFATLLPRCLVAPGEERLAADLTAAELPNSLGRERPFWVVSQHSQLAGRTPTLRVDPPCRVQIRRLCPPPAGSRAKGPFSVGRVERGRAATHIPPAGRRPGKARGTLGAIRSRAPAPDSGGQRT